MLIFLMLNRLIYYDVGLCKCITTRVIAFSFLMKNLYYYENKGVKKRTTLIKNIQMILIEKILKKLFVALFTISIIFSCSEGNTTNEGEVIQEESNPGDGIIDGDIIGDGDMIDGDSETPTPTPITTPTNGDIILTDNLVIDKSKEFVNFKLSNSEYEQYITREANVSDITKEIYNHFNDDFDLIIILATEIEHPVGQPSGFYSTAKTLIQGIGGSSTFDGTARFGSNGKLNGVLFMPLVRYVSNGPFLHEIAHIWGNKGFIPTTVGGHWGYASTGGQLGGFDTLTDLGNNTYKGTTRGRSFGGNANGGNGLPYSNTELYVMGLIPENELESIQVAINPVDTDTFGEFTADEIKTYTREELIEMNGKRVPSFEDSQKEFKTLTVILTPEDSLEETDKDDIISRLQDFFKADEPRWSTYNFWTATGERAIINNQINTSSVK